MPFDRFMIAPMEGGLQNDLKPWLTPDDSFEELDNVYNFRGRMRKRFGSRLMNTTAPLATAQLSSRLRVGLGSTNGSGNASGTIPGTPFPLETGQMFSIGTQIFTVYQLGSPMPMLNTGGGAATYDTVSGAYVFTGVTAGTQIYFYPALPVQGFIRYQTLDSTSDPTYAFDTEFAYQFTGGAWSRLGTAIWTGDDSQFFWGATWRGALASDRLMFVVNNNAADGIQYWNGNPSVLAWATLTAQVLSLPGPIPIYMFTSLMVVVYKNYLIFLNTTEGANVGSSVTYANRARWSALGNPLDTNAFRGDIPGHGNAIDAATLESIVSCGFIKDQLIVYFERSTWTLKYTNNAADPFTWQKVNTELGAESTFSAVPFDKVLLAIGSTGIHACSGTNVERIDNKIPDTVWDIHTGATTVDRVAGIRDFYVEQVYWTFPSNVANTFSDTYPNKVLVYNYKTGTWAFNDDSITVFGYYYESTQSAVLWSATDIFWDNTEVLWSSGSQQPLNQDIIAGNQEGFTFIIDSDETNNAQALQITNITIVSGQLVLNVINHNLNVTGQFEGDFLNLQNLNGLTGPFLNLNRPITSIIDANNFTILAPDIYAVVAAGGMYTGGGTAARVSRINMLTKQFNFYVQDDRNSYVQKVDFLVDRTANGEVTVDYQTSTSTNSGLQEAMATGALVGTSILETTPYAMYPFENNQERLWHPVYFQSDGTCTQLRLYLSNDEMANPLITTADFQLGAMIFYCVRSSSRLQ